MFYSLHFLYLTSPGRAFLPLLCPHFLACSAVKKLVEWSSPAKSSLREPIAEEMQEENHAEERQEDVSSLRMHPFALLLDE
jgi:hypothetical protein